MLFWFRSAERISKQENLRAVQNFMRVSYIAWWGTLLGLFLLASSVGNAQFTRDDWGRADEATVRLSPSTFLTLPSSVRTELERRECTIPQPYGERVQEMNVVSGKFTSTGETDWAVLCSRQKRSAILVFHGGRSNDVEELAEEPDLNYLQVISRGRENSDIRGNWQSRHLGKFGSTFCIDTVLRKKSIMMVSRTRSSKKLLQFGTTPARSG